MTFPSTPFVVRNLIRQIKTQLDDSGGKATAGKILIKLRHQMETQKISERVPRERTIFRILQQFEKESAEVQRVYKDFAWPESFIDGSLPWEAAPVMWELLNRYRATYTNDRPTIENCRWFWRITLAAPDLDFRTRLWIEGRVSYKDPADPKTREIYRKVEDYLRMTPWKSPGHRKAYDDAIAAGTIQKLFGRVSLRPIDFVSDEEEAEDDARDKWERGQS